MLVRKAIPALLAATFVLAIASCSQPTITSPLPSGPTKPVVTAPSQSGTLLLTNLRMVSTTTGWAVAVSNVGNSIGTLVRTTDGGAHWHAAPMPTQLGGENLEAVDVHDGLHAWVLMMLGAYSTASHETVVVASTADGGRHWSMTPNFLVDGHGTGIQFSDAAHGWVFATPSAGGVIGAGDTTLYRTIDGGVHWQSIKAPSEIRGDPSVVAGLPEACPMGGPISRPTFLDPMTGWLGAFCSRPFFYASRDGGLSWHPQSLPPFPGSASTVPAADLRYFVDSFQAVSASELSVVVHRGITTGGNALQDAGFYVSHDGGATWAAIRLPYAELADDFIDALRGWMIAAGPGGDTERRSLYATLDGGHSWLLADGPQPFFGQGLNFVDALNGFVADRAPVDASSLLLRTSDGGRTWTRMPTTVN